MDNESSFRQPSILEEQLLSRLVSTEFPGRAEIVKQMHGVRVMRIDHEGSLVLRPSGHPVPAIVDRSIPVEAEGVDEDGIAIHLLLHVHQGLLKELEIYKDDGSPIRRMPRAEEFTLLVLPFEWRSNGPND